MIRFIVCCFLLLSLQAPVLAREYTTSFSLKVNNRLDTPLQNIVTHQNTGEIIELIESVPVGIQAFFMSANQDGVSNLSTSGLISFQLVDRINSDFTVNNYLTLLWSVPANGGQNILKLAITTGDSEQDGLYNDLFNSQVGTFSVSSRDSWQVWKPNFTDIEIHVFCNNESQTRAAINVVRRTLDFPASLMISSLNQDYVIELFDGQVQQALQDFPQPDRQSWKAMRAYDDIFYLVNQEETQFLYAEKTSLTTGNIVASDFEPENQNNYLWEIKKVRSGFTIRAVAADLYWNTNSGDNSQKIVLTSLSDSFSSRSTQIFKIEAPEDDGPQDDFLLDNFFSVLEITNPQDTLALTPNATNELSVAVDFQSHVITYDGFWLMKKVSDGKFILQDFDSHLALEAIDQNTINLRPLLSKTDTRANSQLWKITKNTATANTFTIESIAYPGRFITKSGTQALLGSSYAFNIQRLDFSRNMIQENRAYSLVSRTRNTLTYDASGPIKATTAEYVHLNHRFNFSSSNLAQISPLAANTKSLTLTTGSSLIWQEGSTDTWRIIPASNYYNILIQLQNERTGAYLSASAAGFTTTLDSSQSATYFKAYSLQIPPPEVQWDQLNPLALSHYLGRIALTANNDLLQKQTRSLWTAEYNVTWNAVHIYGDIWTLKTNRSPSKLLSGDSNLLRDVNQDEYLRKTLWRITKDGAQYVNLVNLDTMNYKYLGHQCNAQPNLALTASYASDCSQFKLESANNFSPFNQPTNSYYNLINGRISTSMVLAEAKQQVLMNNNDLFQQWVFTPVTYLNKPAYMIWSRANTRVLTCTAAGALDTSNLPKNTDSDYVNKLWTVTQYNGFTDVLRIQSVRDPNLFLASADVTTSGAAWRIETGQLSDGIVPTIGIRGFAAITPDLGTLKVIIARLFYQNIALGSDGKQTQASSPPNFSLLGVQWSLIPAGVNRYQLQNVQTGNYLAQASGTDMIKLDTQTTFDGSQYWEITPDAQYNNLVYTLKNVLTGKNLNTPQSDLSVGAQFTATTPNPGNWPQRFKLIPVPN